MIQTDVFFADVEKVITGFTGAEEGRVRTLLAELNRIAARLPRVAGTCAVYRGRLYALLAEGSQALAAFDEALTLNPRDPEALLRRGDLHRDSGRYHEALADYERALQWQPDSVSVLIHRGDAHYKAGDLARAREDYERAQELEPRSGPIAERLKLTGRR